MPLDPERRERRLAALRRILVRGRITRQSEILDRLRRQGFSVTQSSVSRDLRDLGVVKKGDSYRLPSSDGHAPDASDGLEGMVRSINPAGPHLLVVRCVVGAAARVGLMIDGHAWPEVVGTVAGDDTLFVATAGRREQIRVAQKLAEMTSIGGGHE